MKHQINGILVHPEDLTESWIDRMAQAHLNLLGLHPVGGKDATRSLKEAIDGFSTDKMQKLRACAKEKGIDTEYEAHAMGELSPRELFTAHPEYYRMNEKEERTPDVNLCPSNPDALERVAQNAENLAKKLYTGTHRYSFWMDDVQHGACLCPQCRKLSPADQALRITNAVARGIHRFDRDAIVYHLAYHDTLALPTKTEPAEGVALEFAPIHRDFHTPIADKTNERNAKETAPLQDLLSFFGRKNAKVLEYWMDNSLYSNWKKPPKPFTLDEKVLMADAEYYDNLGFEILTSFGCYLGPDYEALYGTPDLTPYGKILSGKTIK